MHNMNYCMNFLEGTCLDWRKLQNSQFKPQIIPSVGESGRLMGTTNAPRQLLGKVLSLLLCFLSLGQRRHLQ